jgi:cytochrome d ubiquinol oxidase subunit I
VREVVKLQPVKFAAIELLSETATHVPERLGGHMKDGVPTGGIKVPDMASMLTGFRPDTKIVGMDSVAPADRPPATIVHWAFDVMVFAGSGLALLATWFGLAWVRRRDLPRSPWFLRAAALAGVVSYLALEAGWVTTEVGRQPWVVYHVMTTAQSVTGATGIPVGYTVLVITYIAVAGAMVWILRRLSNSPLHIPGADAPPDSTLQPA